MRTTRRPVWAPERRYQTVSCARPQSERGSLGSSVAPTVVPDTVAGKPSQAVAVARLSLGRGRAGGAAAGGCGGVVGGRRGGRGRGGRCGDDEKRGDDGDDRRVPALPAHCEPPSWLATPTISPVRNTAVTPS